ncbi:hypothetical protein N7461_006984 [Penicillium sp. DV-2018c]|nr:hypothetical protein N7461_006984 [Penicillium sp. DV-2018c]
MPPGSPPLPLPPKPAKPAKPPMPAMPPVMLLEMPQNFGAEHRSLISHSEGKRCLERWVRETACRAVC